MQLRRAIVRDLHGLFTKTVVFFDDYTFIHGINGTGKTSILRAIQALTQPDLDWLISNEFKSLEVWLLNDDSRIRIKCHKDGDLITFDYRVGNSTETESFDLSGLKYVIRDQERKYDVTHRDPDVIESAVYDTFARSKIIQSIQKLPAPIVLGLSRTSTLETTRQRIPAETRWLVAATQKYVKQRVTYDTSMADGLAEAVELIQNEAKEVSKSRAEQERKLRDSIALVLFSNPKRSPDQNIVLPTSQHIIRFRKMKNEIISALSSIGFDRAKMDNEISGFFDSIISSARYLSRFSTVSQLFDEMKGDAAARKHFNVWFGRQQLLPIIDQYASSVERFVHEMKAAKRQLETYADIMNSFFMDSHKSVMVDDIGNINITLIGKRIDLSLLSSGEKQIFVLISHLMFNPRLRKANVLIIDEPELSLHVRWQEIFVESVLRANPKTQLILATHSPSIVLDRRHRMVDLNAA